MAYVAKITNTKVNPLTIYFRVPGENKNRQLISLHIPARALNYPVAFADEEFFNAFKDQNRVYLENETIILGDKIKENKAEKVNQDNANKEVEQVRKKKNKIIKFFEDSLKTDKASMKVNVEKE